MEASSKPHPLADGSIVWNGIALDVTARKEAELALAEQTRFVRQVTERTPLLLYVYDVRSQRNIWSNESHKHYFGTISEKPADTLSLDDITKLCDPEDLEKVVASTEELVRRGGDEGFDHPIRLRNGRGWREMMLNVSPFERDEQGRIIRVIGSVTESS
jgi:PAS domain-containing protein